MISNLRALSRLLAIIAAIKIYYFTWWLGLAVVGHRPAERARWRARIFNSWSRTLLSILKLEIEVIGEPPAAPFLLVSNHLSYIDVLLLASQLDAVFVAKAEVASWPLLGTICRSMDTIFIERGARHDVPRVLAAIDNAMERGDGVVIFPEGTSSAGDRVLPFRSPLLATAASLRQPVHYATLSYATTAPDPPADLAVCWWGAMTFPAHFWRLLGLRQVIGRLRFGAHAVTSSDRKQLAATLHAAVSREFEPVVGSAAR